MSWDCKSHCYKPMYQDIPSTDFLPIVHFGHVAAPFTLSEFLNSYVCNKLSMQENVAAYAAYATWFHRTQSLVNEEATMNQQLNDDRRSPDSESEEPPLPTQQYDVVHYIHAFDSPVYASLSKHEMDDIQACHRLLHAYKLTLMMSPFFELQPPNGTAKVRSKTILVYRYTTIYIIYPYITCILMTIYLLIDRLFPNKNSSYKIFIHKNRNYFIVLRSNEHCYKHQWRKINMVYRYHQ